MPLPTEFNMGSTLTSKMISRLCQPLLLLLAVLFAASLAGCASINERASAAMGDYVPQWPGGLPADAPPRPGTAKYDEWMKERERQRQLPSDQRPPDPQASASAPGGTPKPLFGTTKPSSNGTTGSTTSTGSTPSGLDPVH